MKKATTLSTNPTRFEAAPFSGAFDESLGMIARHGYDGVELAIRDPALVDQEALREALQRHGLVVPAVATGQAWVEEGLSFTSADPAVREKAVERVCAHVPFAGRNRAVIIIGLLRGVKPRECSPSDAESWMLECFRVCAAAAGGSGVRIAIEPINRYETSLINNVREGLSFLDKVKADNLGLLLDTFHMNIEEPVIEESIRLAVDRIFHFHVADSNRWHPGAGHLNFRSILEALYSTGYDGFVSGEHLPKPDAETSIRRCLEHLAGLGLQAPAFSIP
jgi:sugar phosphate isomerase/epimerase